MVKEKKNTQKSENGMIAGNFRHWERVCEGRYTGL